MTRQIPKPCPTRPKKVEPWPSTAFETLDLQVQVVTPMFGGGAEAGNTDPVTLIRPSSIRGHLRFWWRATRGAACQTIEELKRREVEIFGDTEHPSPLIIEVNVPEWRQRREPDDYGFSRFGPEAYALFSAKQNSGVLCKEGLAFTLRICWFKQARLQALRDREIEERRRQRKEPLPEIEDISPDVKAALAAWLIFGGLGARTRRGCGSLRCLSANNQGWIKTVEPLAIVSSLRGGTLLVGSKERDAMAAWASSVSAYREFRQKQRGMKQRNGQTVPESRSHWPEPDSIRKITDCALPGHTELVVEEESVGTFPRAALGLPIIFWFKDGPGKDFQKRSRPPSKDKDPCDAELVPEVLNDRGEKVAGSRMASPVITKPVFLNGEWRSAIVVFPHPHISRLTARLKVQGVRNDKPCLIDHPVANNSIVGKSLGGLQPMAGLASAIDAFVTFAKLKNFTEVTP